MRFALIHKTATYLMVATGFAAAFFGGEVHEITGALFVVALLASWFWEAPLVDRDRFVRWWNGAAVAALVLTLVAIFPLKGDLITNAFRFLTFLQVNKLFNRRTSRDYLHSYVLSFLMLVLATALNTELNYGLWFVLYLVFTTWTLILFHLKREMEDNYLLKHSEDASRSRKVEIQRILNSRRIVGVPFLAATSGISVVAFLLAVAAFFVFPRVGFGLFFANRRMGSPVAGFSDYVRLGEFGTIKDDPTVVMRVEMDQAARAVGTLDLRWRGNAYDVYDGRSWGRATNRRRSLRKGNGRYQVARPGPRAGLVEQRIYLEPIDEPYLFALDRPVAVEVHAGPQDLPQGAVYEVESDMYGAMLLKVMSTLEGTKITRWTDPSRFVSNPAVRYTVVSDVGGRPDDGSLRAADAPLDEEARKFHRLHLQGPPSLDPRVGALARRWVQDAGATTAIDKARAIEARLRSDYRYTTVLDHKDKSVGPLEDFLFVRREGHCEYFATAMALMLREVGVPSRYVQGFLGGQYNRFGDFIAVSHGDAHSWVEAWLPAADGWVSFEPTPSGQGPVRLRSGLLWTLSMYADALRLQWYRYVIEYDLNRQFEVLTRLREWLPRLFTPAVPTSPDLPAAPSSVLRRIRERPGHLVAALGLCGLLALAVASLLGRRRRDAHGRPIRDAGRRSTHLYRQLLRLLERRGHRKGPSDTALEFLDRLERKATADDSDRAAVDVAREVTAAYLGARFGEEELTEAAAAHLAARVRTLRGRRPPAAPPPRGT